MKWIVETEGSLEMETYIDDIGEKKEGTTDIVIRNVVSVKPLSNEIREKAQD